MVAGYTVARAACVPVLRGKGNCSRSAHPRDRHDSTRTFPWQHSVCARVSLVEGDTCDHWKRILGTASYDAVLFYYTFWKKMYTFLVWILAIVGLIFPRVTAAFLYFLTNWFAGVFETWLWPLVGFIFAPYTMLWYSVVVNWYGGEWNTLQFVVLAIAAIADLSASGRSARG